MEKTTDSIPVDPEATACATTISIADNLRAPIETSALA
jgi:hypothetical protein